MLPLLDISLGGRSSGRDHAVLYAARKNNDAGSEFCIILFQYFIFVKLYIIFQSNSFRFLQPSLTEQQTDLYLRQGLCNEISTGVHADYFAILF